MKSEPVTQLSNEELLAHVRRLARRERAATARLIAALAEVEARHLYLGQGCASLYAYCTRVLRLSEHAAYRRIGAARVAQRYPEVLGMLKSGEVTLTTLCKLSPHLTDENHTDLLRRARRLSKRGVELLIASLYAPQIESPPPGTAPAVLEPVSKEHSAFQVTIPRETEEKLRRLQDLLRHTIPDGDLAKIVDRAADALLVQVERRKIGGSRPTSPRNVKAGSRRIPADVRKAVWKRDGGRCAFVGKEGRCGETARLEFHHVKPFALGGRATAANIQLRCGAHNRYEAKRRFGPRGP
jgi:hypothetical protein